MLIVTWLPEGTVSSPTLTSSPGFEPSLFLRPEVSLAIFCASVPNAVFLSLSGLIENRTVIVRMTASTTPASVISRHAQKGTPLRPSFFFEVC